MEVKKSHKADLEHLRPWMFLGGLVSVLIVFLLILEIGIEVTHIGSEDIDDDISMDLNLKPDDQKDMIAAAEKSQVKEAEEINKVDNLTDLPPEQLEQEQQQEVEEEKEEEQEDEPINQNEDDPETLRIVQELPQYPGGMVEFMKWLTQTLKYPPSALRNKVQGKVMISFIVNTDGALSDIKVEKSANYLLDAEALRVARMMPKWTPGKDHGKVCRTKVAIPIVFEI